MRSQTQTLHRYIHYGLSVNIILILNYCTYHISYIIIEHSKLEVVNYSFIVYAFAFALWLRLAFCGGNRSAHGSARCSPHGQGSFTQLQLTRTRTSARTRHIRLWPCQRRRYPTASLVRLRASRMEAREQRQRFVQTRTFFSRSKLPVFVLVWAHYHPNPTLKHL